jgi:fermentation-respiration switch protein FrsA (DUF1100 family)
MRLLAFFLFLQSAAAQFGVPTLDGLWQGTLQAGASQLRVVLHLNGSTGTFDSIDQGALGLPVDLVELKARAVTLGMKTVNGSYKGTLSPDGKEIAGTWRQGTELPLTFRRIDSVPELSRPQDPKKPYPYTEEEVVVPNEKAGIRLAGTLTLPKGAGPFPAVVMITGSGPQDRDESLMGHRPFLVIADQLTRNGIAVLRVDDRGTGKSTGTFGTATTADFAADTMACLRFLKARSDIDAKRMGLIGHSEGGIIAPMVAAENDDVAFIVMLAGTAVPGSEVLFEQQRLIARVMLIPGEMAEEGHQFNQKLYEILRKDTSDTDAKKEVEALFAATLAAMPIERRNVAGPGLESQKKQATSPWFRYFLKYDPGPALRKVHCPVLAMNGDLDLQVSANQNLPVIAKALEDGGNKDYEIVKFARLNHLFQTASTGAPSEYATISETISPAALDAMTVWIQRHLK